MGVNQEDFFTAENKLSKFTIRRITPWKKWIFSDEAILRSYRISHIIGFEFATKALQPWKLVKIYFNFIRDEKANEGRFY